MSADCCESFPSLQAFSSSAIVAFLNGHLLEKDESLFSSTIQRIWHLLPGTEGNAKRSEKELRREPKNASIPVPRFQSGGGLINHIFGTYSLSDMIDYPRFPISDLHLGKISGSIME